ncbi:MAG: hypothetical protein KJN64_06345 [Ignavibacteria bacterium]|nr:hypothetical protein [Ignavibacteria bacterium]MBT8383027.1 hypothetical protein [Ignavibacteria bacterium]MBT8391851.1 hypothetical protein [Ignavibacteria bacterium]NNJ53981.1 hypothetical protein [Ignavibacteriaceae bacterium]NNL21484.1 hypothetical protein [Ignavibacteriaceae bacterium]
MKLFNLIKYLIIVFIFLSSEFFADEPPASKAVGVFLTAGVGPRIPVGDFSNTTDLGYGIIADISYTDSDYLPFFIFARLGFEQYPGSQDFYLSSDYSNFSTMIVPASLGVRYYFSPLVESIVLLIPVVEASASFTYMKKLHEFKIGTQRNNFNEEVLKFGASAGVGISMFILEIIAHYNYFQSNQYISFNLNVRLPLFVNL